LGYQLNESFKAVRLYLNSNLDKLNKKEDGTAKVQFLDGPSLAEKLPELVKSCAKLDIAIAYVKINGLRTLLKNTNSLFKCGGSLRIVFGLSTRQGITDKESAESLFELSRRKNVTVKKWNHCGFHPKLFIFHGDHTCIVAGSANLTEAAQSTNAEANILIEEPDPQLLQDAQEFFDHYFDSAPLLKRKDVDAYKRHIPQKNGAPMEEAKEDDLPSPPQRKHALAVMKPNKIWNISPGRDARCWNEWVRAIDDDGEGIVAIGWNEVGNLDNFKSYDSLRQAVAQKAMDIWNREWGTKTKVKYVTDQLWTFKTAVSKSDVFIVYSESRVLGLAEVTAKSKYQYEGMDTISYAHQINVQYKWYKQWPKKTDGKIIETLGKQGTLKPVNERWLWDYLVKKLP